MENQKISLTFISTGSGRMRPSAYTQSATSSVILRRLRSLTDRNWTDPFPIGVFLIHHPNGPILFDTGSSPRCNDPGYFPIWNPSMKLIVSITVTPEEGVLSQLRARGVEPTELQAIVLSHLHHDHTGGLKELANAAPNVPIYISQDHWEAFGKHPFRASIEGCVPREWPKSFAPHILKPVEHPIGPWKTSYPITPDNQVIAVDTPGHVPGHISLIVCGVSDDGTKTTYFLAGDATYGIDLLDKEETDGINDDPLRALDSLRLIKDFAKETELVVLPSHDANTPKRLAERSIYRPK